MNKGGIFALSQRCDLIVHSSQQDGVLTLKCGTSDLTLRLKEWLDLFREHNAINVLVHDHFKSQSDDDQLRVILKGWEAITPILNLLVSHLDPSIRIKIENIVEDALDFVMAGIHIGDTKRIRVRFNGIETQVHFYEYNNHKEVVTLAQLNYDEWMEFYRHITDINKLTQNRLYVDDN